MARGTMPSVAQEHTTPSPSHGQPCKKRRWDDDDSFSHRHPQLTLYGGLLAENFTSAPATNSPSLESNHNHGTLVPHTSTLTAARKLMPLPISKRQRTSAEPVDMQEGGEAMQRSSPYTSPSQRAGQSSPSKTHRAASPTTAPVPTTTSAALMSRCHICSRKPSKKSDLDSFADCQGCRQRTCYVCIRECSGWGQQPAQISMSMQEEADTSFTMLDADEVVDFTSGPSAQGTGTTGWARGGGHRQMVCSRCCIEKGADGDVVCLGCLPFVEG
ncbi:hypothetical protein QBC42DRAFT_218507 [Cladorrhinum samala]|uniref:Uncharacterized protein n=1 Tax=Cladorrhinum samala TaxID=585594 RepID=A0AAV9I118_9PEZI|nr:hypothetical protein QBC42DRAFT_218507 [Cladorrhinum samala]